MDKMEGHERARACGAPPDARQNRVVDIGFASPTEAIAKETAGLQMSAGVSDRLHDRVKHMFLLTVESWNSRCSKVPGCLRVPCGQLLSQ